MPTGKVPLLPLFFQVGELVWETGGDHEGSKWQNFKKFLWGLGKSRQAEAYRGEWLLETNYFWILGPKLGTGIRNSWYLGTGIWEWNMSSGLLGMGMRRWYSREWSGTGITFNFNLICPNSNLYILHCRYSKEEMKCTKCKKITWLLFLAWCVSKYKC